MEDVLMKKEIKKQEKSKAKVVQKTLETLTNKNGGFKKQYLKSRPICKVTFSLPKEAAPEAQKVALVGEFSNWNKGCNAMKLNKYGNFTTTLELPKGKEYRFRYLVDDNYWVNDWRADEYVRNPFGGDDSVVIV
jgi:1,4-alpha-glucan branching enzyme